jgi:hypothetical protein
MKVFVVLEQNEYTHHDFCGVFNTKEKAEQKIDEIVKEFKVDMEKFYIDEIEI